jgi:hypothetical protein
MKRQFKKSFIAIISCLHLVFQTPKIANAQSTNSCFENNKNGTVLVFTNGVFNTRENAQDSLSKLVQTLPLGQLDLPGRTETYLAYNDSDGVALDLLEAFKQKVPESYSVFFEWLSDLNLASEDFRTAAKNLSLKALQESNFAVNDPRFVPHITAINGFVTEGKRIIQVATPAARVASGGSYFTYENDLVIGAVYAKFPLTTLPANLGIAVRGGAGLWHGFVETYLANAVGIASIRGAVFEAAGALHYPTTNASGPITVTLNWGEEADVDLHVFEPQGSHVFYQNKNGLSGFLDTDNIEGFGPEHYFVKSCDTLQEGTYRIGANYFAGEGAESATIFVKAGTKTLSVSKVLPMRIGSNGNNSPVTYANVVATKDQNTGLFSFKIEQK